MSTYKIIPSLNVFHRLLAMMMVSLLHQWPNQYAVRFVCTTTSAFQVADVIQQQNRPGMISFFSTMKLYGRQRNTRTDDDDDVENYSMIKGSSTNNNKTIKKENLPSKICVVCNRPFTWRKKWERCWDEITTCSKKCNGERRSKK